MTPLAAFQDTIARAHTLLRLHDGLVNQRQRRIRADWKGKFTALMHWPAGAAIERVDSAAAVIALRDGAKVTPHDFTRSALDELLRSALVIGVSALDRYVHERVTKGIVSAMRAGNLNRQQRDFAIPVATAIQIADRVRAARNSPKALRPANEIRKAVQEVIHKQTYQGWRDIEGALRVDGTTGLAGKLQTAYRVASFDPLKKELNQIVRRRNEIVHEGNLEVHQRGGGVNRNPIEHKFVEDSLKFLEDLVTHLEQV
jgi:hypothetical protein